MMSFLVGKLFFCAIGSRFLLPLYVLCGTDCLKSLPENTGFKTCFHNRACTKKILVLATERTCSNPYVQTFACHLRRSMSVYIIHLPHWVDLSIYSSVAVLWHRTHFCYLKRLHVTAQTSKHWTVRCYFNVNCAIKEEGGLSASLT